MESSIMQLLGRPFSKRTLTEQQAIVRDGPPQAYLHRTAGKGICDDNRWLTACPIVKKFFCWPCLLFSNNKYRISWTTEGLIDCDSFLKSLHKHETSIEHIDADLQLKMFYRKHIKDIDGKSEIDTTPTKEFVKKNREAVGVLINIVCDSLFLEPILNTKDESNFSNTESYLQLLESSKDYFSGDIDAIDNAINLIKQSPKVVDYVTESVAAVLLSEVKTEIKEATFVAVILNEHSELAGKSCISTILRYINGDDFCERFIGYSSDIQKTADGMFSHIVETLYEYDATDKFLAYSVDGMVLPNKELHILLKLLRDRFPSTFFTPWYCHDFGTLLLQSLCEVKECHSFFKTMNALRFHCERGEKGFPFSVPNVILDIKKADFKFVVESLWCDKNSVISATLENRRELLDFFSSIIQKSSMFNKDDVTYVYGFRRYIRQFQTVFLLTLFSRLANYVSNFSNLLKCVKRYVKWLQHETLIGDLKVFRNTGFEMVWSETVRKMRDAFLPRVEPYQDLFKNIMDNLMEQVEIRLENQKELKFNSIFWRSTWRQQVNGRMWAFWQLIPLLRHYFPTDDIMDELNVMHLNDDVYQNNSMGELFKVLVNSNIKKAVPHVFKLAELCYTLPFYGYSSDLPSKHMVIQDWSVCRNHSTSNSFQAVLRVEAELLRRLRTTESFYENVMSHFTRIHHTVMVQE